VLLGALVKQADEFLLASAAAAAAAEKRPQSRVLPVPVPEVAVHQPWAAASAAVISSKIKDVLAKGEGERPGVVPVPPVPDDGTDQKEGSSNIQSDEKSSATSSSSLDEDPADEELDGEADSEGDLELEEDDIVDEEEAAKGKTGRKSGRLKRRRKCGPGGRRRGTGAVALFTRVSRAFNALVNETVEKINLDKSPQARQLPPHLAPLDRNYLIDEHRFRSGNCMEVFGTKKTKGRRADNFAENRKRILIHQTHFGKVVNYYNSLMPNKLPFQGRVFYTVSDLRAFVAQAFFGAFDSTKMTASTSSGADTDGSSSPDISPAEQQGHGSLFTNAGDGRRGHGIAGNLHYGQQWRQHDHAVDSTDPVEEGCYVQQGNYLHFSDDAQSSAQAQEHASAGGRSWVKLLQPHPHYAGLVLHETD